MGSATTSVTRGLEDVFLFFLAPLRCGKDVRMHTREKERAGRESGERERGEKAEREGGERGERKERGVRVRETTRLS